MRPWAAFVALALALIGQGCMGGGKENDGSATDRARVERCTERFLASPNTRGARNDELRRYVERTYCAPFVERGWVYEDGTLSIAAHAWIVESSSKECVSAEADEPARTIPCEELELAGEVRQIDCALLRFVRRSEVQAYVERLQRESEIECDDGTPLTELGASS